MTTAHTATPWVADGRYVGTPNHKSFIAECRDQNGNWTNEPMALENAFFIVTACNAYHNLLAALQKISELEGTESNEWDAVERLIPEMAQIARDALAKAGVTA